MSSHGITSVILKWTKKLFNRSSNVFACVSKELLEKPKEITFDKMTKKQKKVVSNKIRNVLLSNHAKLRKAVQEIGEDNAETVWKTHLQDKACLKEYTSNMHHLATTVWEVKNNNSRISWIYNEMQNYFKEGVREERLAKEARKVEYFKDFQEEFDREREKLKDKKFRFYTKLKILDVGSCYNPFGVYNDLDVTAIDICPVVPEVKECDFLSLRVEDSEEFEPPDNTINNISKRKYECEIEEEFKRTKSDFSEEPELSKPSICERNDDKVLTQNNNSITVLKGESFDAVIFSLFLSYIPSPRLRFQCCQKAYELLKSNGVLLIVCPNSKPNIRNFHLVKLWKITLQHIGFDRVTWKKDPNFHGFVYRKALSKNVWKIDAEKTLIEMRAKQSNEKIFKKFKNFDYDTVREMYYIHQDIHPSDEEIEDTEKIKDEII